jgi:hypothetical protein
VAFALHQHAVAGPRQESQGQVIGERPARHEHRRLLAEQCRYARLQLGDNSSTRIIVLRDAAGLGNLGKKAGIGRRRQAEPVRAEMDDRLTGDIGSHRNPHVIA